MKILSVIDVVVKKLFYLSHKGVVILYFKYLCYIIKNKHYVLIECFKLKVPVRGVLHDIHKLLPSEFIPYAKFFYGKQNEEDTSQLHIEQDFDLAWLKHQHRGKHHWQYWVSIEDNGGLKAIDMPLKYKKEMLADWIGAGKAITGKNDVKTWYYANRHKMVLHPATKYWVEKQLESY